MHFMQRIRIHKYGRVYYTCIWSVYVCIIWIKYSTNLCDDGKSEEKYACIHVCITFVVKFCRPKF